MPTLYTNGYFAFLAYLLELSFVYNVRNVHTCFLLTRYNIISHNIIMVIIILLSNYFINIYIHIIHTALKAPLRVTCLCAKLLEILIHTEAHNIHN